MDLGSPFLVTLMLLGYVLTVASITRLINYDQVLDPVRLFIARRMSAAHEQAAQAEIEGHPTVAEYAIRRRDRWALASDFIGCPWCVSPYIAAACAPAVIEVLNWPYWTFFWIVPATRYIVGWANRWVADPTQIVDSV